MTGDFTPFSMVLQSYQDDERCIGLCFSTISAKGNNFLTFCLLLMASKPFQEGVYS